MDSSIFRGRSISISPSGINYPIFWLWFCFKCSCEKWHYNWRFFLKIMVDVLRFQLVNIIMFKRQAVKNKGLSVLFGCLFVWVFFLNFILCVDKIYVMLFRKPYYCYWNWPSILAYSKSELQKTFSAVYFFIRIAQTKDIFLA